MRAGLQLPPKSRETNTPGSPPAASVRSAATLGEKATERINPPFGTGVRARHTPLPSAAGAGGRAVGVAVGVKAVVGEGGAVGGGGGGGGGRGGVGGGGGGGCWGGRRGGGGRRRCWRRRRGGGHLAHGEFDGVGQ